MRHPSYGTSPSALAVPSRPPHRRLWTDCESLARPKMSWHMPAEWEPHEATWLAWPHEKSDWPGKYQPIPWLYGELVRRLAGVERVRILTEDEPRVRKILEKCGANLDAVAFFNIPTNQLDARLLPAFRE